MKNILIFGLTVICISFSTILSAQYYPDIEYKKGDVELAVGVGLMNTFIDKNTEAPIPPLSVTIGYRLKDNISVGTYLGYSRTNYVAPPFEGRGNQPDIEFTNNYFQIGVRGQGHYTEGRLDFYGGAMVGYNFSINDFSNLPPDQRLEGIKANQHDDIFIFSGHIGMKYLVSEHIGFYGEVGYGVSIFNIGLTTRF